MAPTAYRIPDQVLETLREASTIADLVGEYVELKPGGAGRLKGLCPFHQERSPSFFVNTDWNRYHCFGCGADGDAIKFLMEIDGLSFRDAVTDIAGRAGITVPTEDDPDAAAQQRDLAATRAALDAAAEQAHTWLLDRPDARPARDFLRSRHFTSEHAKHWQIGYCPTGNDTLTSALLAAGHREQVLLDAGLARRDEQGRIYDPFRGRIVWPLHDPRGRIVGFTGRDLTGRARAKYLNTAGTVLFNKSEVLFGYTHARQPMLRGRRALVTEGQTDVMALVDAGFTETVAASGTAFTSKHAELVLARVGDGGEVVTVFDNDEAGRGAAWSVFLACQSFTTTITAVRLDQYGEKADACDVRTTSGPDALASLIEQRTPLLRQLLYHDVHAHSLDTPEGKVSAVRAAQQRLDQVQSAVLRREYAHQIAEWAGVEDTDVPLAAPAPSPAPRPAPDPAASPAAGQGAGQGELALAAHLVTYPGELTRLEPLGGLYQVFAKPLAEIVEVSASMFPGGLPTQGADAELWAEAMTEVVAAEHHPLMWLMAFTEPIAAVDALATAERLRRRQLLARQATLQDAITQGDDTPETLAALAVINQQIRGLPR